VTDGLRLAVDDEEGVRSLVAAALEGASTSSPAGLRRGSWGEAEVVGERF